MVIKPGHWLAGLIKKHLFISYLPGWLYKHIYSNPFSCVNITKTKVRGREVVSLFIQFEKNKSLLAAAAGGNGLPLL